MDQLVKLMVEILNNSCGLLSEQLAELAQFNGGFQRYIIEAHCVQFTINARRNPAYSLEDPRGWEIRDWTTSPC